jgi:hypothetical protein
MPNVTVQVSRETYRNARIWCAQNNTNVSRIVRDILEFLPHMSALRIALYRSTNSAAPTAAEQPAGTGSRERSRTPAARARQASRKPAA